FFTSLIVLTLITIILYSDLIINAIVEILERFNINSRSIAMITSGEFSNDNGRSIIWDTVIRAIKEGGIFGYGIMGDRPFIAPIHYVGYSHNIFLEIIVSFGLIGYFFIAYLVIDSIRMIFFCKDVNSRDLFAILFSISCQLLLSMSFWYVWEFW